MKILHTSDLHSNLIDVFKEKEGLIDEFDVWVDTGDFFPNNLVIKSQGNFRYYGVDKDHEVKFQKEWLKKENILEIITKWLNGRPFISVSGNHDFISLVDELKKFGCPNVFEVSSTGFELFGLKWAGFPNINWIGGFWNHETVPATFYQIIDEIKLSNPDILITHSPPHKILDVGGFHSENLGIVYLSQFLFNSVHNIKHHFFGHIHELGGSKTDCETGVTFYNGSTCAQIHNIDINFKKEEI